MWSGQHADEVAERERYYRAVPTDVPVEDENTPDEVELFPVQGNASNVSGEGFEGSLRPEVELPVGQPDSWEQLCRQKDTELAVYRVELLKMMQQMQREPQRKKLIRQQKELIKELTDRVNELETAAENDTNSRRFEELTVLNSNLVCQLAATERDYELLEQRHEQVKEALQNTTEQMMQVSSLLQDVKQQNLVLTTRVQQQDELLQVVDSLKQQLGKMEAEITQKTQKIADLQIMLDNAQTNALDNRLQQDSLARQLSQTEKQLNESLIESQMRESALSSTVRAAEPRLEMAVSKLRESNAQIDELERENIKLQNDLLVSQSQVAKSHSIALSPDVQTQALIRTVEEQKQIIRSLRTGRSSGGAQTSNRLTTDHLAQSGPQNSQLQAKVTQLAEENAALRKQMRESQTQLIAEEGLEELVTRNSRLMVELNQSRNVETATSDQRVATLVRENQKMKTVQAENEALRAELARERRKREQLISFYAAKGTYK